MQPPRPRFAARHLLIVVLAALLLSPGTPHPDPSPNSPDRNLYPGASDRDPYPGAPHPDLSSGAPHSDLSPGAPHRDPSGTGAPTGRVARPEERVLAAVHSGAGASGAGASGAEAGIEWRRSRAVGRPNHGRLLGGVKLPAAGANFVTVDPVAETSPNRAWRRYGSDRLVRVLLRVAREHAAAHPGAARLVVGDLSRPHGGRFGPEYGGDGHRSHQNGLDADVYYPRRDGLERIPRRVGQVDKRLAQELVNRFVRAGAQYVFVGPRTGLRGPAKVVMTLANHDDHLHVRIRPGAGARR